MRQRINQLLNFDKLSDLILLLAKNQGSALAFNGCYAVMASTYVNIILRHFVVLFIKMYNACCLVVFFSSSNLCLC